MSTLVINSPTDRHHGYIVKHLREAIRADLAVSYVQQSGVNALRPYIERLCKEGQGMRLICSFDMGITDPKAVAELKALGVEVRVHEVQRGSFHPKVWLFGSKDDSWHSLIGSANLTAGAMFDNVEVGVLSKNGEISKQARDFFNHLWTQCHPVSDTELKEWAESHQRRKAVARKAVRVAAQQDEKENVRLLEEYVTGWIDIGVAEQVKGAGSVFGRQWRGWYIIPDHGEIDDALMARLAAICKVIAEQANGQMDISKGTDTGLGTALGKVLSITAAKLRREKRKMSDRDLFIRQEKNYLVHLGLATMPEKNLLALSEYGHALASNPGNAKAIYTAAMESYIHNGLNLLEFTLRLLSQAQFVDFTEFSFFVRHAWTMDEVDAVATMIRVFRALAPDARQQFIARMDEHFKRQLEPTAKGVKMNYDKSVRHTMSALGWCEGLSYDASNKALSLLADAPE